MKTVFAALLMLTAILAVVTPSGRLSETGKGPSPAKGPEAPHHPPTAGSLAAKYPPLGWVQSAGPFQVILTASPSRPTTSVRTRFSAIVIKDKELVLDAQVVLELYLPASGPNVVQTVGLKQSDDHYQETAHIAEAGEWLAKLTVAVDKQRGTATYLVPVAQGRDRPASKRTFEGK